MFLKNLFNKRYKVIKASHIQTRDVTRGFEKRNINKTKIVIEGKKKMQYYQELIVKRKNETKSIKVYVNYKLKRHKDQTKELILKPKKVGDTITL